MILAEYQFLKNNLKVRILILLYNITYIEYFTAVYVFTNAVIRWLNIK